MDLKSLTTMGRYLRLSNSCATATLYAQQPTDANFEFSDSVVTFHMGS